MLGAQTVVLKETDTCRICSAPAEPDQPLFHPCKCSGTIRYIHQDCLTTWLSHSKKKTCDVCKHPYSFTKVYAPDMPSRLPPVLLIRRLAQQALWMILFAVRGVVVATIWLAVLPWATVWTWRMYFFMGEATAWWISNRERPSTSTQIINPFYSNVPAAPPAPTFDNYLAQLASHPTWLALSADIFTGQIIASVIVLTFVAVFLLREWISQNARPGVFEDEDVPVEERPADPIMPQPQPRPQPQILDDNERQALARRQLEAIQALDAMRAREGVHGHLVGDDKNHGKSPFNRTGKASEDVDRFAHARASKRHFESLPDFEEEDELPTQRRIRPSNRPIRTPRRRIETSGSSSLPLPPPVAKSTFEFTFRAEAPFTDNPSNARSNSEPPLTPFPAVVLEPPNVAIPFAITATPSPVASPRRPPLPATVPVTPGSAPPTPLASPSLATYRAPEELETEAGPSGYFDGIPDEEVDDTTLPDLDERDRYFRDETDEEMDDNTVDVEDLRALEEDDEDEDEAEDLFEDEQLWEAMDDEDVEVQIAPDAAPDAVGVAGIQVPLQAPQMLEQQQQVIQAVEAAAGAAAAALEQNEDLDGNVEDDMEGAMEAIGMRGPIHGVLQNAALMVFVLDTAIGLGVWIPFTIGKSTALLALDPPRFLQILHFPIRAIRILTDPVVDAVVYVIMELFLPPYLRIGHNIGSLVTRLFMSSVVSIFGQESANKTRQIVMAAYSQALAASEQPLDFLRSFSASPKVVETAVIPAGEHTWVNEQLSTVVEFAEPYFAALGKEVRVTSSQLMALWTRLALGHAPKDRVFAVILGYQVVAVLLALYLNLLTVGNVKTAGRAVRSAVRQQLLVLKVGSFIFIELVIFPLACGIVLDLTTVWLFPNSNLGSRFMFFYQAPLTAMFYHWVAGTMFMYGFAVLLAACRAIMRPGAMWFIKDPQDQNSHPIRDILDRPTFTQLRKIFISGMMYTFVVVLVAISLSIMLVIGNKTLLPFRWKTREPLSNVPIDLLFLHLVLPYTMYYFRPRKALKKGATVIWKFVARQFRLTSYFFGDRIPAEETPGAFSKSPGSYRRVPATDHIALPRDMRATASVNAHGFPTDETAKELIAMQNAEATKAKREIAKDYMIVYIPPHFAYRVFALSSIIWTFAAASLGMSIGLPIQLGRSFFKLFLPYDVHDGYSFIIGFYLLWGCYLIGKAVDRLDKRRQRRGVEGPRADLRVLVLKRGLLWFTKTLYMVLFLGIIIPTLLSFVVDLYIILPVRFAADRSLVPRIRVIDSWILGLLYLKIGLYAHHVQVGRHAAHPIFRGIEQIARNGWTRPDPIAATKDVIAPLTAGLIAMILLPGLGFKLATRFLPVLGLDNRFLFLHVYPTIFAIASFSRSGVMLVDALTLWSQSIRDKEFLVEMRLRNHEPETKKAEPPTLVLESINVDSNPQ
ncbi:hypothetical protein C8J56DRAFT_803140 [Mycena floridula]|nr:hypothetical protein C8J56DRAFT_803140 [Mycena floridula]